MVLDLFQWIQYSPLMVAMRSSWWLFPLIACLHLLGLALLGGSVLVVDLRLLGLGLSRQPVAELAREAHRWMLLSLAVMFPTGVLLLMCFATKYYYLKAFWLKMAALAVALTFTFTIRRHVIGRAPAHGRPLRNGLIGLASLLLWTTIALSGRWIGFP